MQDRSVVISVKHNTSSLANSSQVTASALEAMNTHQLRCSLANMYHPLYFSLKNLHL